TGPSSPPASLVIRRPGNHSKPERVAQSLAPAAAPTPTPRRWRPSSQGVPSRGDGGGGPRRLVSRFAQLIYWLLDNREAQEQQGASGVSRRVSCSQDVSAPRSIDVARGLPPGVLCRP